MVLVTGARRFYWVECRGHAQRCLPDRLAALMCSASKAVTESRQASARRFRASGAVIHLVAISETTIHGIVVKNNFHTPGGVVAPGAVIFELLPIGDERIIEAHVNPRDISHVSVGQEALVRLSALTQRITPMVGATVIYVSADALTEHVQTNAEAQSANDARREFYVVRVRLDRDDILKHMPEFIPTPGMPADLYIKTGERTFFEYTMKPVLDSLSRGFRET
jgi:HlyD family secretion protein